MMGRCSRTGSVRLLAILVLLQAAPEVRGQAGSFGLAQDMRRPTT